MTASTPWLPQKANLDFLYKMPGKNKTKGMKKILMTENARNRPAERTKSQELLWPPAWAARTSLKSFYLA